MGARVIVVLSIVANVLHDCVAERVDFVRLLFCDVSAFLSSLLSCRQKRSVRACTRDGQMRSNSTHS